jgi:hypothetical protein
MKRALAFTLIAVVTLFSVACHKNSTGPSAGYGANSLFPTTAGDTWYYVDSASVDTPNQVARLYSAYPDTMVATTNAKQDANGSIYLGMQDPYGWFAGSYINVDPNNTYVQEVDSPAFQPYTMFALVSQDGPIAQEGADYTNPACPIYYNQIGYANPVTVDGYSCYLNSEVITNCSNVLLEQTNYYLSPGVGVVRIEDFVTDTTGGKNIYFEDYSQTLTAKTLH